MLDQLGMHNTVDVQEAALTMAIAVLVERIRALPKEDKNDLFELAKALFVAETTEEEESAANAIREILEQSVINVKSLDLQDETGQGLKKWIDYIGGRIKQAREFAGLTQTELSTRAGLPQSHISRLENGQHSPSFATLEKIAKALNIPISQLDPSAES
ncbi:MAG: helix-turn-helix transcriptional regulator [Thermoguttaceae bacterium]|jgi:DNA-binding XRE family transcriptional regulator